jgi:hypothetical protein
VNITEVGMGSANNSGTLFSRALIKDGSGNPVALTITPIDYLDVTYIFRVYPYIGADITGQVNIGGVQTDYILRSANVTTWNLGSSGMYSYRLIASVQSGTYYYGDVSGTLYVSTATLGPITGGPTGSDTNGLTSTCSTETYSSGTLFRYGHHTWSISQGNVSGGAACALLKTTRGQVQISFNPVIPKDNTKTLDMRIKIGPISRYVI